VAVFRGLGVPRRLVTVLEGESLFNDATALVAYQTALAAAATATFSLGDASLRFLGVGIGGLLVGLVVGWLVAHLQRHLVDPAVEIAVSLLTPFGAYVLAEQVHVSGVLATVAAGLCAGWWAPSFMAPETRLRSRAVWDMVAFLLNGLVFILIGLQLLRILAGACGGGLGRHARRGLAGDSPRTSSRDARARPAGVRHLLRHPGDARRPGADAAVAGARARRLR
jgi:CPA1 family monovalent cation:H+ antiporter